MIKVFAGIAHLVERSLAKAEVAGSSPVSRSNPEPIRTVGSGLDRKACQRMEKFVLDKENVCRYSVAVTH